MRSPTSTTRSSRSRGSRSPAIGRTTCAEILHGARTKKIERNSYDGLPGYGTSSHMRRADIVSRIDELIEEKRLATSGGAYPVLKAPRGVSLRLAVLVSGEGSNLQAILDSVHGRDGIVVAAVGSNKESARGLERADGAGVRDRRLREGRLRRPAANATSRMADWLESYGIDLLVLAGFMEILGARVHPALQRADDQRASVAAARRSRASARSSRRSTTACARWG